MASMHNGPFNSTAEELQYRQALFDAMVEASLRTRQAGKTAAQDHVRIRHPHDATQSRVVLHERKDLGPGCWAVTIDGRHLLDETGQPADISPNYRDERWRGAIDAMTHFNRVAINFDKIRRTL